MNSRIIVDGISLGPGKCAAVLKSVADESEDADCRSWLVRWELGQDAQLIELDFVASALVEFADALFVLGRLGTVARFVGKLRTNETINCPEDLGFLTDIRNVGGRLAAVGMWRQVYVRNDTGIWSGPDEEILDHAQGINEVTGLRAVSRTPAGAILGIGLEGEIWVKQSTWLQDASPTNSILEQACAAEDGEMYLVGQRGTILRGLPGQWQVVNQPLIRDDLWGVASFKGQIYVTTGDNIFLLGPQGVVVPVESQRDGTRPRSKLQVDHGALWSFSWDGCCWTEDGVMWREASFSPSMLALRTERD